MLVFKKFSTEFFESLSDELRSSFEENIIFINESKVLMLGRVLEDYHGNGSSTYYFYSDGVRYLADGCLYLSSGVTVED